MSMQQYTTKVKGNPVYSGGHIVGTVKGDTFRKVVLGSKHFLHKPPAICISLDALAAAEAGGAQRVEVFDKEDGSTYRASVGRIRESGFTFNRGFGSQIGLPLDYWSRSSKRDDDIQPPLFGNRREK